MLLSLFARNKNNMDSTSFKKKVNVVKSALCEYCMSTECIPMTDRHKDIITNLFEQLTNNLSPDSILPRLVSKGIISTQEQDKLLKGEQTAHERASSLLRLLLKKEDRAFHVLIEACRDYNMPQLAKLLQDAGIY